MSRLVIDLHIDAFDAFEESKHPRNAGKFTRVGTSPLATHTDKKGYRISVHAGTPKGQEMGNLRRGTMYIHHPTNGKQVHAGYWMDFPDTITGAETPEKVRSMTAAHRRAKPANQRASEEAKQQSSYPGGLSEAYQFHKTRSGAREMPSWIRAGTPTSGTVGQTIHTNDSR